MFKKGKFSEFLENYHMAENPTVLDDDLPDSYDDFISNLSVEEIIAIADIAMEEPIDENEIQALEERNKDHFEDEKAHGDYSEQ